jgi:chromosome partitioning protein
MASRVSNVAMKPPKWLLKDKSPNDLGEANLLVLSREMKARPQSKGHIIVFANEKGGVGKSTFAFHCCVALCNAGHKVAAIDLDSRQQTLSRALENREGTGRRLKIDLPRPKHVTLGHQSGASLNQEIARIGSDADYIVIDAPGHDSPMARLAIAMADTLVTPVNGSFVDLDLLGQFDPVTMKLKRFGNFSRLVQELREVRDYQRKPPVDWVVVQNRQRRLGTNNQSRVKKALDELAPKAGFRLAKGFGERVAYRELFLLGMTVLDLKFMPDFARAQPEAKHELKQMMADLKLPVTESVRSELFA